MTFVESDLTFEFLDAEWQVMRYDTHRYFKILSGAGLKGVDFIGIYRKQEVVFIEVKNFRTNHPTKPPNYTIFEDTEAFIHQIADKLEDSLQAVQIIKKVLLRKWWYRFYLQTKKWWPRFLIKNRDWYYWHRLYKLAQKKHRRTLVLWLEIDHHYAPFSRKKLKKLIDQHLEVELLELVQRVEIGDRNSPVFASSVEVS